MIYIYDLGLGGGDVNRYEIMLANGDSVYYKTEMSFQDFKDMLAQQEWIEIERDTWESTGYGSWSARPPKASYQTKSIVYVNWDKEWNDYMKERESELEKQMAIKREILNYKPNFRLKWKYRRYDREWEQKGGYWDEVNGFYRVLYAKGFLEELLEDCKKYKCSKRFK